MTRGCPNPACRAVTGDDGAAFCARCGAPLSGQVPPTLMVPMVSPQWAPPMWQPPSASAPRPARPDRTPLLIAVSALTAALVVVGGVFTYSRPNATSRLAPAPAAAPAPSNLPEVSDREEQHHHGAPTPVAPVAPPAAPPGEAPTPTLVTRPGWLSSVHYRSPRGVDLHPGDLDGVDGRCVRLTGAMMTLELPGGSQFVSDGDPQRSDLEVRVGSPGEGSFDLEIGVGHNRFVPVVGDLTGNQTLDLDQLGVRVGRFVRISTRRTGATVCVDAVSVSRAVPGSP